MLDVVSPPSVWPIDSHRSLFVVCPVGRLSPPHNRLTDPISPSRIPVSGGGRGHQSTPDGMFMKPETSMVSTDQLRQVYEWVIRNRNKHAYRFLSLDVIRPQPNESNACLDGICNWCDTQIDAFTLFRCKQLLSRDSRRRSPLSLTTTTTTHDSDECPPPR